MRAVQQTFPTALPLSLCDAKDQCRIEQDETFYDVDLVHLIRTAGDWVQDNCHVTLISTEFDIIADSFPTERRFKLPVYPVISIDSIAYVDATGTAQTLTGFQEALHELPAAIYPAVNTCWPDTQEEKVGAVTITLIAGYGADDSAVPNQVKHLLRLLVAHWFKHREAVLTGTISKEIEIAADNLMKILRVNEFEAWS
jgi:uncharacterized phiE125 gp8 family phage protein